jgi:uncharacterized protein (TIGR03437 family)
VALWSIAAANAAGPGFCAGVSAILGGSGQDYAAAVATDPQGNVYVAGLTYSPDFPVTPGALQTKIGTVGTSDAFVAKFAPDGALLWSTYLGGCCDDWATGVAVDSAGNVLVTGWTRSANFPLLHPFQGTLNNGASAGRFDAFVAKLDPTGSKLLYSTFLGSDGDDGASGIAVDAAGNAYITGMVNSSASFTGMKVLPDVGGIFVAKLDPQGALIYTFLHPYGTAAGIAVDAAGSAYVAGTVYSNAPANSATQTFGVPGDAQAMVFKVSADGSKKLYETTLGGSIRADGMAIAVDRTGAAYLAGTTTSVDFPLVRPLQSTLGARPLWKSSDGGATWVPLDDLPFAYPQTLLVDPPGLYAATWDGGIFMGLDSRITSNTWNPANHGLATTRMQALAIDPQHPQVLYAATAAGVNPGVVYKTVDGGNSWRVVDSSPSALVEQFAVDARNPSTVYSVWNDSETRKTLDSGATWSRVPFPGTAIATLAPDPQVSGSLWAYSVMTFAAPPFQAGGSPSFIYHSTNGGTDWVRLSSPAAAGAGITVDASTNPSTLYAGLSSKSVDGGVTWSALSPPPGGTDLSAVAVDPNGVLYAASPIGMFVSHDRAQTWTPLGSPAPPLANYAFATFVTAIVPAGASGTLYALVPNRQTCGFVTKLSADGSNIAFSTLLRGHVSLAPLTIYAAEPGVFTGQNWIDAIALDAAGNVVVAGGTRSNDFPIVNPAQASSAGKADAFAAVISADGSRLTYSTYVGGSQDDGALAVTTDTQGNVILAGQTWSYSDFPVPGGVQPPAGQLGDVFVAKLAPPAAPVIASVLDAASFQPGIEAGSWVTIRGTNLANTNPGRTWRTDEVVNGNLPTSLDGVSVTINGKPAFVYYISPTQINVQAPSDTAVGAVSVVVTNRGAASAPASAQLQAVAPAFFQYPGADYATASRLPDYAAVADPAAVLGTVAAKPGDLVVLWGTGFGATNPPTPAGTVVSGAPVVVTAPTVMVGGVAAQVLSTVLTTGCAGLYQVTIRIPDAAPAGAVAVQATVGGVRTADGVLIFVGQ